MKGSKAPNLNSLLKNLKLRMLSQYQYKYSDPDLMDFFTYVTSNALKILSLYSCFILQLFDKITSKIPLDWLD